jgi:hypothetical protein
VMASRSCAKSVQDEWDLGSSQERSSMQRFALGSVFLSIVALPRAVRSNLSSVLCYDSSADQWGEQSSESKKYPYFP